MRDAAARLAGLLASAPAVRDAMVLGSATVLLVTAVSQLLALALQVLLARLLGPVEFGVYSYVAAALAIGLILAKLGLDSALVRLIAEVLATGEAGQARGMVRFARSAGLVAGILLALAGIAWAEYRVPDPPVRAAMLVAACLLPLAVVSELTAAGLRGLQRPAAAISGDGLLRPLIAMVVLAAGAGLSLDLTGSSGLLAYLLGTLASLALTSRLLGKHLPPASGLEPPRRPRRYLAISLPLMMASGLLVAIYSVDTLMLGSLADTTTAGYYAVSSRVALFVLFVMNVAQSVASPMIAAARVSGRPAELRGLVRALNGVALLAAVPATIVFLAAAEPLLGIFGAEFQAAAPALRILVLSQFLNVLTGPTGTVLSMTGHERALAALLAFGLVTNVALNLVWIPAYGLAGAAWASLAAQLAWNVLAVVLIRKRLGIDVTTFGLLRSPPAGSRG